MAATALKKINARAKALRKKHPKASYKSLQKQAGKEYKAGKLKKRAPRKKVAGVKRKATRKRAAPRKKVARKRAARVKVVTRMVTVGAVRPKRRRRKAAPKRAGRRRRVGNSGNSNMLPIVLGVVGLAAVAYMVLKPSTPTAQLAYQPTGNATTDNKAAEIMAWASAAGLGITAITQLINALNAGKTDQLYNQYKTGGDPLASVAGVLMPPYSDN